MIKNGDHAYSCGSIDNVTNGTALLIEGTEPDETDDPSILWGVEALGIRIAGAFDYGIRCINTNYEESGKSPWKYETKIDALIDGCRTGMYMDHYNNARISAVIKTRQAYRVNLDEDESLKYAEYGIHLVNCKYIDLRNSRIIDKDPETDTLIVSDEFKHISLEGLCRGLMIENSLCSGTDGFNIRDYIHTTIPENFEGITILGEPSSRFFELGDYGTSNLYKNYRIVSGGAMEISPNITSTDYISCTAGATVKLNNINLEAGTELGLYRILFYTNINEKPYAYVAASGLSNKSYIDFDKVNSKFTINTSYAGSELTGENLENMNINIENLSFLRICCNSDGLTYNSSIEVDNTKTTFKFGELKDQIRIKAQNIKGLEERVREIKAKPLAPASSN